MPHDEHVISDNFFYSDEHVHHRVGLVKIEYKICSPLILRNSITLLAIATAISFLKIFPIILYTKVPLCSFGTSTNILRLKIYCMQFYDSSSTFRIIQTSVKWNVNLNKSRYSTN